MEKIMKLLAAANLISWAIFILIDKAWNHVISDAVAAEQSTYGELFGPLSFLDPSPYTDPCLLRSLYQWL
jgi:hypothetical protein